MLWGWTTKSKIFSSKLKRYFASINSKHLLTKVAESIVTLLPISQFGWFKAWSKVTFFKSVIGEFKNGPPEAVIITFCTSSVPFSPERHWKIALCSLSIGIISDVCFFAKGIIKSPPATILSLLANNIFFPVVTAIDAAFNPAKPDVAQIIISISVFFISCSRLRSPFKNVHPLLVAFLT